MRQPLLKRPGGKFKKAKRLVACLPEHSVYVEPFAGGASVYWNKPEAKKEVINDIEEWIVDFYRKARDGKINSCRKDMPTGKALVACHKKGDPCCTVTLNRRSYHGNMIRDNNLRNTPTAIFEQMDYYRDRLSRTELLSQDWKSVVSKYDNKGTLFYLDPPYVDRKTAEYSNKFYDGRDNVSMVDLERFMSSAKGKVVMSYSDQPETRAAFCNGKLKCYSIEGNRNVSGIGTEKQSELLVTNFNLTCREPTIRPLR